MRKLVIVSLLAMFSMVSVVHAASPPPDVGQVLKAAVDQHFFAVVDQHQVIVLNDRLSNVFVFEAVPTSALVLQTEKPALKANGYDLSIAGTTVLSIPARTWVTVPWLNQSISLKIKRQAEQFSQHKNLPDHLPDRC